MISVRSGLLLKAGDIETNPDPKSFYPCGICRQNVKWRTWSISCTRCAFWFHQKCLGFSISQMRALDTCRDIICQPCTNTQPPNQPNANQENTTCKQINQPTPSHNNQVTCSQVNTSHFNKPVSSQVNRPNISQVHQHQSHASQTHDNQLHYSRLHANQSHAIIIF